VAGVSIEEAAVRGDARAPILAIAAFLAPPLGLFAPLGLSPLLFVTAAALLAVAAHARRWPQPPRALLVGCAALALWAALSAAWAIDPGHSLVRALRLVAELGSGLILLDAAQTLTPAARNKLFAALVAGLFLGAILVGIDRLTDGALVRPLSDRYNGPAAQDRGSTVCAMLIWPALLWFGRRFGPLPALLLLAATAATVILLPSDASRLALGLGGVIFLLGLSLGRLFAREGMWAVPLLLLAMPFLSLSLPPPSSLAATEGIKPSGVHRLIIWRFAAEKVAERPLLGWGFDASRELPGMHDKVALPVGGGQVAELDIMPLHPHNNAIQIWLELGVVGALIPALLLALLLRRLARPALEPGARAMVLATVVASLVVACLSYGLWQGWWLGALWFAAAFAAALFPSETASP
jgi:exopolysaccharide production protein ExoQ